MTAPDPSAGQDPPPLSAGAARRAVRDSPRFWFRIDVIATAVIAVVLAPATTASLLQATGPALVHGIAIALFLVLHGASFAAIRAPRTAFVVASAVMLALALLRADEEMLTAVLYPSSVVFLLCLGRVAVQCDLRLSLAALGVGILGSGIVAVLATGLTDPLVRIGLFGGLAAANAAAWAFGALQRARRIRIEESARMRTERAVLAERGRISRDLHDVVAHAMTAMIAQAEVARASTVRTSRRASSPPSSAGCRSSERPRSTSSSRRRSCCGRSATPCRRTGASPRACCGTGRRSRWWPPPVRSRTHWPARPG